MIKMINNLIDRFLRNTNFEVILLWSEYVDWLQIKNNSEILEIYAKCSYTTESVFDVFIKERNQKIKNVSTNS